MSDSIAFLGRQPALGTAELERLYGADALQPIAHGIVLVKKGPASIAFARLGGTVKLGKVLTRLDTTDWRKLVAYLTKTVPEHLQYIPEGKIRFGLNVHGLRVPVRDINRAGLEVKKCIKAAGRSVRVVPNSGNELNSAQTLHNQLTGPTGLELSLVKDGTSTLLVQITNVQDIDAYAARDQKRPKRDARVGMLPPKLAQIIINLANPPAGSSVLDPFCGTGVLLQEALLMGFGAYGTDLEPRMVEYTNTNLIWLAGEHSIQTTYSAATGDATNYTWQPPIGAVACETYLGKPFATTPDPTVLRQVVSDVNVIHKKFLQNIGQQLSPGTPLCLAVPAWAQKQGFKHLPILDSLEELGYTRVSFVHVGNTDLIYHRENQVVARELVVLTKK